MSKGLEALERLIGNRVFTSFGRTQGKKQFANDINIIEKELKRLEELEKSYKQAIDMKCAMERIINRDSKKLKALDFIKDMLRNIGYTISLIKNEELVIQIGGKITIRLPKEYDDTLKEAGL